MASGLVELVDPDASALEAALQVRVHPRALGQLLARPAPGREPRPTLEGHGDYVFGVFVAPVVLREADEVVYREIDFVLTRSAIVTVRKTPAGCDAAAPVDEPDRGLPSAMIAYRLVDGVAEAYLDLLDSLNDEIDELEDHVEDWHDARIRNRVSTLRHDLLHLRQTLAPTRDAVRRVFDGRVDLEGAELFDRDLELHFADAYDKLLRAVEGLELARDLVAGVRDYHVAKVAQDQNEVTKRLTAIASLLLLPTFIVGLYGQNFIHMPELRWRHGYAWSWFLILATTALQLYYYRRKRWI